MAYGIAKSLPREQIETSSVKRASYAGLDRKGGNAASSIEGIISKMGNGTGNVKGQDNQKEKG
tara:strand:- start:768 stop:956 length:189 start_codon:yes stop_codon:yes gene_type:complete